MITRHSCHSFSTLMAAMVIAICLSSGISQAQSVPMDAYAEMRWRLVGPYRAGWVTVAAGVPEQPNVFYIGVAGGGVWKTNDAGLTWKPIMDDAKSSSIGALAVAPSNSDIIYVGTGQVTSRYDILSGDGVYRSDDAGKTWKHVGLEATHHIGSIVVDPEDQDRVLVAAMGQAFASNPERGVFLTTDGGKKWQRVLYVNDETGAVDLAQNLMDPNVVYASTWRLRQHPWLDYFQPQVGQGSAIYKSTDRGSTWNKVEGTGLPPGPLGRVGLGVEQGGGGRLVYATIVSSTEGSGFYRSMDGGQNWKLMNADAELSSSYFGHLTVSPDNPDVVYQMGRSIHRTTNGGETFTIVKGAPGGDDYHFLWLNPFNPSYMITGADQGAAISINGGETWSDWYNQPTGQFYHLAADNQFPYRIYSGQQDNGTVSISSRGPYGVIEERDWRPTGGEERCYQIPKPGNPDIIMGTGLGGYVSRANRITGQVANVSPWPVSSYGARPTTVRYRYTWITPLEYSPVGSNYLYFGAQMLFRSSDDGDHWDVVSPDLTGKKRDTASCVDPNLSDARDCGFGTIFTIAPSPIAEDVLWIGTGDGLIHVTTDGCKTWKNVTPPSVPMWGLIRAISPSSFSRQSAYAAVDLHRLGRYAPLIIKTTNGGANWQTIITGLPPDEHVTVVRADPAKQGVLYAGTNRSVYVSFDDGGRWQPLKQNLPPACVTDMLVHQGDLIISTEGRGIWILDNLSPLRELSAAVTAKQFHLFEPLPAWRVRANLNQDTPPPPSTPLGQNPPSGAIIDYWLKSDARTPLVITIRDSAGNVVRAFASDQSPEKLSAKRYFEEGWLGQEKGVSTKAGMHRFVWDLRYPRPKALSYGYTIAGVWQQGTVVEPEGPLALPGRYTVTLGVNGTETSQPLLIKQDPRVRVSMSDLQKQMMFSQAITLALTEAVFAHESVSAALEELKKTDDAKSLKDSLSALRDKGTPSFSSVAGIFSGLASTVQNFDGAPTQGQQTVYAEHRAMLDRLLIRWKSHQKILSRER